MGALRLFRKLVFIILLVCVSFYSYSTNLFSGLSLSSGICLLPEVSDSFYYSTSFNTGITNINGISNVKLNLLEDEWEVYKESVNNDEIDLIFTKGSEEVVRVYYRCLTGDVAFFSNVYESSDKIATYTTDRK